MLTKSAFLNAIQLLVDQLARIVVGFLLMPILVAELGPTVFGIWQVLQKASLQISMLDGRSAEVLKWIVASKQDDDDLIAKQRALSSALVVLLLFFPVLALVFGLFIVFIPDYLALEGAAAQQARLVVILLGAASVIMAAALLFEAVIRGSNLAFKLLGLQALVLVSGGIMSALTVASGNGLIGLAYVQIIVSTLFLMAYLVTAKKHIVWLGVSRPLKSELIAAAHRSKWFTLWAFVAALLFAGDIVLMAAFLEPSIVSKYFLTAYAMQIIIVAVLTALSSILPGFGGILGSGDYRRARAIRKESLLFSWWLTTTLCVLLMVVNKSFLWLWVGEGQYLGHEMNLLIAVATYQLVFIRHDANLLNVALSVKQKTLLGLLCLAVTLGLMLFLIQPYGLYGFGVSLLIGRSVLSFSYPRIVSRVLNCKARFFNMKRILATFVAFYLGWELSLVVYVDSWCGLLVVIGLAGLPLSALLYFFGMSHEEKQNIVNRVKLLIPKR